MSDQVQEIRTDLLLRSRFQKRREPTAELIESVKQHGIIQPLVIRPVTTAANGATHEIIAGERRWAAAMANKLQLVPVIVRQASDIEARELQTTENLQRQDYNPIEEAEAYHGLLEDYKKAGIEGEKAIARLCEKVGKSKAAVYERLSLLKLAKPVKEKVGTALPASHAALLVKLPAEMQSDIADALAPGKPVRAGSALEQVVGWHADHARDPQTGLIPFREAKEVVDRAQKRIEAEAAYDKKAAEHRAKGGVALTAAEARAKKPNSYAAPDSYLQDWYSYAGELAKGVADLPKQVMVPDDHDPAKPVMVWPRAEFIAALKKAGKKPRSFGGGGSMADYRRRERERQERQRVEKRILAAVVDPIRGAATKRNAKIPWPLVIQAFAGWKAGELCTRFKWKHSYSNAGQVLADQLAKMPENRMAGILAELAILQFTTSHTGKYQPDLVKLGAFYGVDVKAIAKKMRAQHELLAELKPKKPKPKPKVQTPGKQPKVSKKTLLTAAKRKRLSALMKARWAARRKAAAKS